VNDKIIKRIANSSSLPLYIANVLDLVEQTESISTTGVIKSHCILSTNFIDPTNLTKYNNLYSSFVEQRKYNLLYFIFNLLLERFKSVSNNETSNQLPINLDIFNLLKELIFNLRSDITKPNITELLENLDMKFRSYIALDQVENKIFNIVNELSFIEYYFSQASMKDKILILRILNYLSCDKYSCNRLYDPSDFIKVIKGTIENHDVFNLQEGFLDDQTLICLGYEYLKHIPYCTDTNITNYSKVGYNYLLLTIFLFKDFLNNKRGEHQDDTNVGYSYPSR
jgi:hypothetical protein